MAMAGWDLDGIDLELVENADPTDGHPSALATVDARLAWARGHHRRLQALVAEYVRRPPFAVSRSADDDGNTVVTAELTQEPPVRISLQLSDMTHQYRATLDNLIGAVRTDGPTASSAFPIATTAKEFDELAVKRRYLEGVPGWAMAVIREFQPLPDNPVGWQGKYLVLLHDIARRDRHRALPVQAAVVEPARVELRMADERIPVQFLREGLAKAHVVYGRNAHATPHFETAVLISGVDYRGDPEILGIADAMDRAVFAVVERMRQAARLVEPEVAESE